MNHSQFKFRRRLLNFGRRDVSSRQNVGRTTKKKDGGSSSFFSPRVNARLVDWNLDIYPHEVEGRPLYATALGCPPTLTSVASETLDSGTVHLLASDLITPSIRETSWSSKCLAGSRRSGLPRTPMCSCFRGLAYLLSAVSNNLFRNGVILSGALGAHARAGGGHAACSTSTPGVRSGVKGARRVILSGSLRIRRFRRIRRDPERMTLRAPLTPLRTPGVLVLQAA